MNKHKFFKSLILMLVVFTPFTYVNAFNSGGESDSTILRRGYIIQVDKTVQYKNGYVSIKGQYERNDTAAYNIDINVTGHNGAKVGAFAAVPEGNRVRVSFSVSYDNSVDYYDIYV